MWHPVMFDWCRSTSSYQMPTPRLSYRWQSLIAMLRLRTVRWMACSALRTTRRVTVNCMVPVASMPQAWAWSPTISRPSTIGERCLAQTLSLNDFGSAVPWWVPTNLNAGPGPAMTTRAVPSPTRAMGPTLSRSMTTVRVRRNVPRGKRTLPSPASTAFWTAAVSSVLPSPLAPKARTSAGEGGVVGCVAVRRQAATARNRTRTTAAQSERDMGFSSDGRPVLVVAHSPETPLLLLPPRVLLAQRLDVGVEFLRVDQRPQHVDERLLAVLGI